VKDPDEPPDVQDPTGESEVAEKVPVLPDAVAAAATMRVLAPAVAFSDADDKLRALTEFWDFNGEAE
jgi:hypothetical protein